MLFFSKEFIFIFLPIIIILYFITIKFFKNYNQYKILLIFASIMFYGIWSLKFLIFFIILIIFNHSSINYFRRFNKEKQTLFSIALIFLNIFILIYFKYYNFLIININQVFELSFNFKNIILPLGISFITFQQIGFIWTSIERKKIVNLKDYLLFSIFFPQIIAGPILIIEDVDYQLKKNFPNMNLKNIWKGVQIFSLGLFKKVFIADKLSPWVDVVFSSDLSNLGSLDLFIGALSYGLQLYFDFSAYSDMAIGLGLIFGLSLPVNFLSPYKSQSISEFWTRWHITLNRFLESLIYFPLSLKIRRYFSENKISSSIVVIFVSTLITFFISGLWHGAGWTFIIWGLYHGFFVSLQRTYSYIKTNYLINDSHYSNSKIIVLKNIFITNLVVFLSWIIFRSENLSFAISYYQILFSFFDGSWTLFFSQVYIKKTALIFLLFLICFLAPNNYEIINYKFKDKSFSCSKIYTKIFSLVEKYYLDLLFIIVLIAYYIRFSFENKPFIYYQF